MIPAYIYINISVETVLVIILAILFISTLKGRRSEGQNRYFIWWSADLIVLFLCQIGMWLSEGHLRLYGLTTSVIVLRRVLFLCDYLFYTLLYIVFNRYVAELLGNKIMSQGRINRLDKKIGPFMAVYGIVCTAVFASSLKTQVFYVFNDFDIAEYRSPHLILIGFTLLLPIFNFIFVVSNGAHIGWRRTILLLSYVIIPAITAPFDYFDYICFSYAAYAFVTVAIYVGIDAVHRRELAEKQTELARMESDMTNMRVRLMMSQIQPHFLFNTLSSISYLCATDPEEAEAAVNEFANFLKVNLRSINALRPIRFETELDLVRNYLKLQKRRFADRMEVVYEIDPTGFLIPALTLQTIVENSIRHGVEARFELTTIWIATSETEDAYHIRVADDGPGFLPEKRRRDDSLHLGLDSAKTRLEEMLNGSLQVETEDGKGTVVTIRIPKT